jgi:hypothetical protein
MMLVCGRIRLVRPSAVIITHKEWVPGKTPYSCMIFQKIEKKSSFSREHFFN